MLCSVTFAILANSCFKSDTVEEIGVSLVCLYPDGSGLVSKINFYHTLLESEMLPVFITAISKYKIWFELAWWNDF